MARARLAFKTNNEAYFEAFEATETETAPPGQQVPFGLLVLAALALAVALSVGLALLK